MMFLSGPTGGQAGRQAGRQAVTDGQYLCMEKDALLSDFSDRGAALLSYICTSIPTCTR